MWIPATIYTLCAWLASAALCPSDIGSIGAAFHAAVIGAIRDPFNGLWLIAFIAGFIFFTDTHVKWFRVLGGAAHAIGHLARPSASAGWRSS